MNDELNQLGSGTWDDWTINVCWENPTDSDKDEREWVKNKTTNTWQKYSELQFDGWEACTYGSQGIRILIADAGPRTAGRPGKYLDGKRNGMVLNFEFNNWSPICKTRRKNCIETNAIHEFGHALSFTHEHNQKDTIRIEHYIDKYGNTRQREIVECDDETESYKQGTTGDIIITPYDKDSIMNYCNNSSYNNKLSGLDKAGLTLIYTSSKDRREAAREICDTNDPNTVASYFHNAAGSGNFEVVKAFLDFEVNPDIQNHAGQTALMYASQNGYFDVVKFLLENEIKNANPNIETKQGGTALMYAVQNGHPRIVEILLKYEYDADPNAQQTINGNTPLMYAKDGGIAKILLDNRANPNIQNEKGQTALMYASQNGHFNVVGVLLENGAKPNILSNQRGTALQYARQNEHFDIVDVLLSKGANPNIKNINGQTELIHAADRGIVELVQKYINNELTNPNIRDDRGYTVLMYSALHGNAGIVKMISENKKTKLEIKNNSETALMIAAKRGHTDVVEILLEKTHPDNIENVKKALEKAKQNRQDDVVVILQKWIDKRKESDEL